MCSESMFTDFCIPYSNGFTCVYDVQMTPMCKQLAPGSKIITMPKSAFWLRWKQNEPNKQTKKCFLFAGKNEIARALRNSKSLHFLHTWNGITSHTGTEAKESHWFLTPAFSAASTCPVNSTSKMCPEIIHFSSPDPQFKLSSTCPGESHRP